MQPHRREVPDVTHEWAAYFESMSLGMAKLYKLTCCMLWHGLSYMPTGH